MLRQSDSPIVFQYRVTPYGESPAPESYFTGCDWTDFTWQDPTIPNGNITVQLTVPEGTPSWEGTKDFIVQIRHKDDESCIVGDISDAVVEIASKPLFRPALSTTEFTLYKGLQSSIVIPVCPTVGMTIDKSAVSLPTGLSLKDNTDSDSPCLTISGKPTKVTSAKKSTIILKDANGNDSDSLTITIAVKAVENSAIDTSAFTAALYKTNSATVDGTILLQQGKNSLTATIATLENPNLQFTFDDWTEYDPTTKTLRLASTLPPSSQLNIAISPDGTGIVNFTTVTDEFTGTIYPITTTASEYDGIYNVAVRPNDDSEGLSIGWMQVKANNGMATVTLNLYDETRPFTFNGCIYDYINFGYIPFFFPLIDENEDSYH